MNILLFIPYYLRWHYSFAVRDLYQNSLTLISFVFSWFSVVHHLKTFFAPWRRLSLSYKSGIHPEDLFASLIVNTIVRLLGMSVRFVVIVCGIVATLCAMFFAIAVFIVWISFPLLILFIIALIVRKAV